MGRHSAPRSSGRARHAAPRPNRRPSTGLTFHRTPPLWRRSPAIPAALVVLAAWGGADAVQLVSYHGSPAGGHAAAAATGAQPSTASKAALDDRISRDSRAITRATAAKAAAQKAATQKAAVQKAAAQKAAAQKAAAQKAATQKAAIKQAAAQAATKQAAIKKAAASQWVRPSQGAESSCFCMRWGVMHQGIDLAGPLGSPILAAGAGTVVAAAPASGFGLWVVIRHDNGDCTVYGHMYHYYVSVGQRVSAGQHIADIGANGQSTGPHLHFGVMQGRMNGPYVDPIPWLRARGVEIGAYDPNA